MSAGILLFLLLFGRAAFSQPTGPAAQTDNEAFKANLQKLISAAQSNPRLKAADARVLAAAASVTLQKSLDPPQVAFEFYQSPITAFPNPFKDQMEYDYSIQQMLPFPGKLKTMAGAEQQRTEMLKADRQTLEQDIIRRVKGAYYELYLLDRRMEINHETLQLVRGFIEIARKQYELGTGKQSDILRTQTELSSLVNDSIILIQQRRSMAGMLNALCNRPVTTEITVVPEIEPAAANYAIDTLLALAERNRPELRSMHVGIAMQQAERLAAGKERLPDFMVRGVYKQMPERTDDWSLMLGMTVPIAPWARGRYASASARADANLLSAQAELDNMRNMIAAEVNDALLKVESSQERVKFSGQTAVPQAQQTLESALADYKTGQQEFLMLIDIQRMLVMVKLDYQMAVMNLLDSQGQLERAVGLSLEDIDKATEGGTK
jgi:outer membrane protein TolC